MSLWACSIKGQEWHASSTAAGEFSLMMYVTAQMLVCWQEVGIEAVCWPGKNDRKMRVLIYRDGKATICFLIVYIYSLFPRGGHGDLLQYSCLENPCEEPGGLLSLGSQFSLLYTFLTQQSFHFLILSVTDNYKEAMKAKCFKNILKGLRIKVKIY